MYREVRDLLDDLSIAGIEVAAEDDGVVLIFGCKSIDMVMLIRWGCLDLH